MDRFIPLSIPNFEGNEEKYVLDAVHQGWVSTGGAYINQLEKMLADYVGVSEVAACQSGTSALHLSLIDADVKPGDMVIVPTLTFIAAVNPVKYQFADPIFMDCDNSLCIDPIKLRRFCEQECAFQDERLIYKHTGQHIKAVIVVHIFGNLADMEQILDIAKTYNLVVIEDATEALGTKYISGRFEGKYAGTLGDYGAYSFNGNKIITTGGGGAVVSNDADKVNHIRYLSTQAKDDARFYIHNAVGYNYRMTNVQAALGVAQTEMLSEFVSRKQQNYNYYRELFEDFEYGKLVSFREGTQSNKWFYSLEINMDRVKLEMADIIRRLEERGIQTRAIWGLIHEQLPYKNCVIYEIEKADYYSKCILNLPCSTQLTKEEIKYVVENVKDILGAFTDDN